MACVLIGATEGNRVLSGQDLGWDQQIDWMVVKGCVQATNVIFVLVGPSKHLANARKEPDLKEIGTYENKQQVWNYYYVELIH